MWTNIFFYRIDSWSDLQHPLHIACKLSFSNSLFIILPLHLFFSSVLCCFFHLFCNFLRVWHLNHDSNSFSNFLFVGGINRVLCVFYLSHSHTHTQHTHNLFFHFIWSHKYNFENLSYLIRFYFIPFLWNLMPKNCNSDVFVSNFPAAVLGLFYCKKS